MAIYSNPFGGVRLTGADARAFRRQFLGEVVPEPPSDSDEQRNVEDESAVGNADAPQEA